MVDLDGQLIHEKSKEREFICDEYMESCAQANGNVLFHLEDRGILKTAANDELNNKGVALCPITPIRCRRRENGDSVSVTLTPLSVESPQSPNVDGFDSTRNEEVVALDLNASPRTPVDAVFDPFAPGPDHMLLAPICKKVVKKPEKIVARRLNFDDIDDNSASWVGDCENADILSETLLMESVYKALLEAIMLKQSEEFYAQNDSLELDDPHTPTSPPPVMSVAETCPAAPVKAAVGSSRNIDPGLCRKLEF
ncbi:hypothetical protein RDABS01_024802 [Bienertia sinuspersici]